MKIAVKNLGAIKQAEFTISDMTIICGCNNTGKSYVTHAMYASLEYLRSNVTFPVSNDVMDTLFTDGSAIIDLSHYHKHIARYINTSLKIFSEDLYKVFAGKENLFKNSEVSFTLLNEVESDFAKIHMKLGSAKRDVLKIISTDKGDALQISLIVDKSSNDIPARNIVQNMINEGITLAIFSNLIPKPFLSSAERTGAAIFQKELDFTRNRLLEMIGDKSTKLTPIQFLSKFSGEYPLAVRRNVDFIRELPNITHKESFISKEHPDILHTFEDIIGGEYKVTKDGEIQYIPSTNKRVKLSLVESSSAVRSLLDIGFYLRHVAAPGDMLMVDEPELNLHPENQCRVARLFAMLVNIGIKVFITTHSDYIIKELNTLIMLNQDDERLQELAEREGYDEKELLDPKKVRVYIADKDLIMVEGAKKRTRHLTLIPADIDPQMGIEAKSFDTTIETMNRVQEEIVWGGDE